jgi:16S rRNA (guanine966-N2)-methyltransferase
VREAVFSILGDVEGATVLDLFAGSGAMAIEALSRGAGRATLVDSSAAAIQVIRRNLEPLTVTTEIRHQRALPFLRDAQVHRRQYDLVFLDPPYSHATALGPELSRALVPVLAPSARVVVESDRREPLKLGLRVTTDERRYSDTLIEIYRMPTDEKPRWHLTTE